MPMIYLTLEDQLDSRLSSFVYGELKAQKIPQETLAKSMGISQSALSQKLRKKRFTFDEKIILNKKADSKGMKFVYNNMTLYIEDSISEEELAAKKEKDIAFLKAEIARCEGMLSNPRFVEKAPKEKVELERQKLEALKQRLNNL